MLIVLLDSKSTNEYLKTADAEPVDLSVLWMDLYLRPSLKIQAHWNTSGGEDL